MGESGREGKGVKRNGSKQEEREEVRRGDSERLHLLCLREGDVSGHSHSQEVLEAIHNGVRYRGKSGVADLKRTLVTPSVNLFSRSSVLISNTFGENIAPSSYTAVEVEMGKSLHLMHYYCVCEQCDMYRMVVKGHQKEGNNGE